MDISPEAMVNAVLASRQVQLQQQVQVSVLKTAMDAQAQGALSLLQAMPGEAPLATSGHLGTQLNVYA